MSFFQTALVAQAAGIFKGAKEAGGHAFHVMKEGAIETAMVVTEKSSPFVASVTEKATPLARQVFAFVFGASWFWGL